MEWATALKLRFSTDIFFSTRIKIISFLVLITIVTTIVYVALLEYAERLILLGVTEALIEAIATGNVNAEIFTAANAEVQQAMVFVVGLVVCASLVAGYLASRLALEPVSKALLMQKKFISSVAHELRTPLAILKTNNEVALFDDSLPSEVRQTLTDNVDDINHLNEILNNLLLFNRTTAHIESIKFERVEVAPLFAKLKQHLEPLAKTRSVTFEANTLPIPDLYGNATAIEQVLFNLTKNAINYSGKGGAVLVTCSAVTPTEVSLDVSDTGPGIAKEDFPNIFIPFFRSEKVGGVKGTGLGLAIVYEIMKLHGGRIGIKTGLGKGTVFTITLPRFAGDLLSTKNTHHEALEYDFSKSFTK